MDIIVIKFEDINVKLQDKYILSDINLEIKEVKLVEKSENAEVVNNPIIDGLSVKTDIRLNILFDYVKYKIIIKNKDNVDLNVKIDEFDKNDYITYIVDKNIDKKISANSEETIYVTIKYEKERNFNFNIINCLNICNNVFITANN